MPNWCNKIFAKLSAKTYKKQVKVILFEKAPLAINYFFAENFNLFHANIQLYFDAL